LKEGKLKGEEIGANANDLVRMKTIDGSLFGMTLTCQEC